MIVSITIVALSLCWSLETGFSGVLVCVGMKESRGELGIAQFNFICDIVLD